MVDHEALNQDGRRQGILSDKCMAGELVTHESFRSSDRVSLNVVDIDYPLLAARLHQGKKHRQSYGGQRQAILIPNCCSYFMKSFSRDFNILLCLR